MNGVFKHLHVADLPWRYMCVNRNIIFGSDKSWCFYLTANIKRLSIFPICSIVFEKVKLNTIQKCIGIICLIF